MAQPRISVQLSQYDDALLRSIAEDRGHSISFLANEMIRRSLHEDVFSEQIKKQLEPINHQVNVIEKFMHIVLSQIYEDKEILKSLLDDVYKDCAG